jgi:hypothetical protein
VALQHIQLCTRRRIPHPHSLVIEPDTIRIPSVENATELTQSVWPFSTFSSAPVDASHTRTVLSDEPDTIRIPSVENATELTQLVWPFSTFSSAPVDASHTRTVCHRARHNPHPVRRKRNRVDRVGVALQHIQLCTRRRIPHPHSLVRRARHNPHPVPRKRNSLGCSPSRYRHQRHVNSAFRMSIHRDPRELLFPASTELCVLCPCC